MAGSDVQINIVANDSASSTINKVQSALKKLSASANQMKATMSQANTQAKLFGQHMQKVATEGNRANSAMKQTANSINKTKTALGQVNSELNKTNTNFGKVSATMQRTTNSINKTKSSMGHLSAQMNKTAEATSKSVTATNKLGTAHEKVQYKVAQTESRMNKLDSAVGKTTSRINQATPKLTSYGNQVEKMGYAHARARKNITTTTQALEANNKAMVKVKGNTQLITTGMNNVGKSAQKSEGLLSRFTKGLSKVGSTISTIQTVVSVVAQVGSVIKSSITSVYDATSTYEQLVGGIEVLFQKNSEAGMRVIENAKSAYKTSQMSMNEYLQNATSFSAKLSANLEGNLDSVESYIDKANNAMADNASAYGTSLSSLQETFESLSRGEGRLLDNLKLGYGGTKTELERLLNDYKDATGDLREASTEDFSMIIDAIDWAQSELGVKGQAFREATTTLEGSANMLKSAWENMLISFGDTTGTADSFDVAFQNLEDAFTIWEGNFHNFMNKFNESLDQLDNPSDEFGDSLNEFITDISKTATKILTKGAQILTPIATEFCLDVLDGVGQGLSDAISQYDLGGVVHDAIANADINIGQEIIDELTAVLNGEAPSGIIEFAIDLADIIHLTISPFRIPESMAQLDYSGLIGALQGKVAQMVADIINTINEGLSSLGLATITTPKITIGDYTVEVEGGEAKVEEKVKKALPEKINGKTTVDMDADVETEGATGKLNTAIRELGETESTDKNVNVNEKANVADSSAKTTVNESVDGLSTSTKSSTEKTTEVKMKANPTGGATGTSKINKAINDMVNAAKSSAEKSVAVKISAMITTIKHKFTKIIDEGEVGATNEWVSGSTGIENGDTSENGMSVKGGTGVGQGDVKGLTSLMMIGYLVNTTIAKGIEQYQVIASEAIDKNVANVAERYEADFESIQDRIKNIIEEFETEVTADYNAMQDKIDAMERENDWYDIVKAQRDYNEKSALAIGADKGYESEEDKLEAYNNLQMKYLKYDMEIMKAEMDRIDQAKEDAEDYVDTWENAFEDVYSAVEDLYDKLSTKDFNLFSTEEVTKGKKTKTVNKIASEKSMDAEATKYTQFADEISKMREKGYPDSLVDSIIDEYGGDVDNGIKIAQKFNAKTEEEQASWITSYSNLQSAKASSAWVLSNQETTLADATAQLMSNINTLAQQVSESISPDLASEILSLKDGLTLKIDCEGSNAELGKLLTELINEYKLTWGV